MVQKLYVIELLRLPKNLVSLYRLLLDSVVIVVVVVGCWLVVVVVNALHTLYIVYSLVIIVGGVLNLY